MPKQDEYNGIFLSTNSQSVGHLNIAGPNSVLKLIGDDTSEYPKSEILDIHGTVSNGRKASLLDCVIYQKTMHRVDESDQCETTLFPNYVVVGAEFIHSDDRVIQAIRYHFENISSLVSGHGSFHSLMPNADEARVILEANHQKLDGIAETYGWAKHPFKPQIGEHPHLLYFSGLWEIINSQSNLGKISLTNRTSHTPGGASGIGICNEVTVNIEFTEPKALHEAIDALQTLHSLLELSLGHRQRYRWIELELIHRSKATTHDLPQTAQLYWSLCNERVEGDSNVSLNDVLLSPDRHPEEFAEVAAGWMNSSDIMGDPRVRFATAFYGNYGINRVVGAANMFDLLPEALAPKTKEVDETLKDAVEQCREIFTGLPESFAKQSVLSSLGRIGKASLRDKIHHRADRLIETAGEKFPELYLPCSQGVIARNHYVHGSKGAFDYQKNFTEFAFIIDTLEFIFAVSDLLDLGWDMKRWMEEGTSMTHSFGAYVVNYAQNMIRLKTLVNK